MAKSTQWRIYYHSLWGQLTTTCSNATEVTKRAALSCSRPKPVKDNSAEAMDPIDWPLLTTLYRAVPLKGHLLGANARHKSRV